MESAIIAGVFTILGAVIAAGATFLRLFLKEEWRKNGEFA